MAGEALARVAAAVAATDPDRRGWLIADAESTARTFKETSWRWVRCTEVAPVVVATDPDRGEAIARSIKNEDWRSDALGRVAAAVAAADPTAAWPSPARSQKRPGNRLRCLGSLRRWRRLTPSRRGHRPLDQRCVPTVGCAGRYCCLLAEQANS